MTAKPGTARSRAGAACALLLAAATGGCGPSAADPVVRGPLGEAADGVLEGFAHAGFSGAVLIAHGDSLLLARGYGVADPRSAEPVTASTLFDIGSLSKQFTAAAVLALAEDGALLLTDSLPAFFGNRVPTDKRGITVHLLLTHTAGVDDWPGASVRVGREEFVNGILARPLITPLGEFAYSNAGYTLLAAIVETRAGRSFEEWLTDRLFEPAGLTRTGFRWRPPPHAVVAVGIGAPTDPPVDEQDASFHERGPGGVLSTVRDLFRWHRALEAGTVLPPARVAQFLAPHVDVTDAFYFRYGYGWRHQRTANGDPVIWHSGYTGAFGAQDVSFPAAEARLILLTNTAVDLVTWRDLAVPVSRTGPGGPLVELLLGQARDRGPAHGATPPPASLAGWWTVTEGDSALFRTEAGRAVLVPHGPRALEAMLPEAGGRVADSTVAAVRRTIESGEPGPSGLDGLLAAVAPLDPYDLWGRGNDWARNALGTLADSLGALTGVRWMGTRQIREREGFLATFLQLCFREGCRNWSLIHWGADERYLLPGTPGSFRFGIEVTPDGDAVRVIDPLAGGARLLSLRHGSRTLRAAPDRH